MPPDDDYIRADLVYEPPSLNEGGEETPYTPDFEPVTLSDKELNDPSAMIMEPKGFW
jgi:hypothetical protein